MAEALERIVAIEGQFDQLAVRDLRLALMGEGTAPLTLDFSRVDESSDRTLALLSVNLLAVHRQGRALRLRGLPERDRQALMHFGIIVARDGEVDFFLREELPFSD